ncbi:DUF6520 family protein [Niabella pedocola]|uniref:DUF6520 family protein n=1 Tax=Niabella pedocola TaxID=1752077 RepID=A0ABS8PTK8_9BACT|nr:DUF6520 family protein [Niabella pedocola]MCD2424394.1 DUF6520 family protein [Niabella pedocola]
MTKFKWLLPLVAILLVAAGVFAKNVRRDQPVKKSSTLYFHYKPNTVSETQYEASSSWEISDISEADCDDGSITCLVSVDDSQLSGSGPIEQQFATYLANQSPSSPSGATAYVNNNLEGTKTAR